MLGGFLAEHVHWGAFCVPGAEQIHATTVQVGLSPSTETDLGSVGLCLGHLGGGYKHEKLRFQPKAQAGASPLIASARDDPITISRVPF